jgi:hypothetical protein
MEYVMTTIKPSRFPAILVAATRRFVPGLLLMGAVLLSPLDARAQDPRSIINLYTGALLTNNGWTGEWTPLVTRGPWWILLNMGNAEGTDSQYKWQFFRNIGRNDLNGNPQNIVSMQSFKLMDVYMRLPYPYYPVVQTNRLFIDNSTQWRFQTWHMIQSYTHPTGGGRYYSFRNGATGMCIMDFGSYAAGGAVNQAPCNASDERQAWAIWNHVNQRWETAAVP